MVLVWSETFLQKLTNTHCWHSCTDINKTLLHNQRIWFLHFKSAHGYNLLLAHDKKKLDSLKLYSKYSLNYLKYDKAEEREKKKENRWTPHNADTVKGVRGLQRVVAGLIDSCRAAVECHHRWWTEQVGIEHLKNIWMRWPDIKKTTKKQRLHKAERTLWFCQHIALMFTKSKRCTTLFWFTKTTWSHLFNALMS